VGVEDRQILILIRQTPQFTDLLKTILRESSALDDAAVDDSSDFEDESDDDKAIEEGNEVLGLTKAALLTLKKLPTLQELERSASSAGEGVGVVEDRGKQPK
jgi:hypothetical protein